jgi:hypothetical protein
MLVFLTFIMGGVSPGQTESTPSVSQDALSIYTQQLNQSETTPATSSGIVPHLLLAWPL